MSSLVLLLASQALALDCAGLDPDLCAAANAAADQINAAAGQVIFRDDHPNSSKRPYYLYLRFEQYAYARAQAECGALPFHIDGTIGGYWAQPRRWTGIWGDLDGSYGGTIPDGTWSGSRYMGTFEGDVEHRMGVYRATASGTDMWMDRQEGYGGGVKRWFDSTTGYIANLYGTCQAPAPEVVPDAYEVIGNTAFVAGMPGHGGPEVVTPDGLFANDPDGPDLRVVGIAGCPETEAPFGAYCTTALGGLLYVEEDGAFAYLPPAGADVGTTDSFEVLVEHVDGSARATSLVELTSRARVWYVEAGSSGDGRADFPAGSLAEIADQVDAGDIVYIGGMVDAGQGVSVEGDVQLLGGDAPLIVDVDLNGVPGPVHLPMWFTGGGLVANGVPLVTLNTDGVPGSVHLQSLEIMGDSGPGLVAVEGAQPASVSLQQLQIGATGTIVQVHQPAWSVPGTSEVLLQEVLMGGAIRPFDLDHAGQGDLYVRMTDIDADTWGASASTVRSTDEAHLTVEILRSRLYGASGFDLQLSGASQTRFGMSEVEGIWEGDLVAASTMDDARLEVATPTTLLDVGGTAFGFEILDASHVSLTLDQTMVGAGGQVLRVENGVYPNLVDAGFDSYVTNSTLFAAGANHRPGIELTGSFAAPFTGRTRLAMGGNELYYDGPTDMPVVQVLGGERADTAVTMVDNQLDASGRMAHVDVRTESHSSELCLDFTSNEVYGGGTVHLQQTSGSMFGIAGLPGSGTDPWQIEGYLQSVNWGARIDVERYGPGVVVDYGGVGSCELPTYP
ncbi:MAG: hypothetical protein H6735_32870 [Alphaproteobacteria bacterium]|nr:hypothetical protein [Alphaproteobacteria bacterium]